MSDTVSSPLLQFPECRSMMSDMSMHIRSDDGDIPRWTLPDRLRKARESARLEQADLAQLLGKKRSTVSNWERGANRPDELALRAIAFHTHVPYGWLVGGDGPSDGTEAIPSRELSDFLVAA